MTINPDLMYAILAMDSYNQGYDPGIQHGETQIGTASVKPRDDFTNDEEYAAWQAAGFYGAAYSSGDEIIISYRGTDARFGTDIAAHLMQEVA